MGRRRRGLHLADGADPDKLVRIDPSASDPASTILVVESSELDGPDGIWHGDDGGIWFVNRSANTIGRVDPSADDPAATVPAFGGPPQLHEQFDIKSGPDGWLWFTNKSGNSLARIFAGRSG